jgi:hypothetical protein
MRSIIALTLLLVLIAPSMALSPAEQAYIDGVKDGLKLGQLVNNVDQYNIAIQQFNDNLNQTFSVNASKMWLPMMTTVNNAIPDILNLKPVHKIDGSSPVLIIGGSSGEGSYTQQY